MVISNITQIRAEDYDDEFKPIIDQLGSTLNYFMQEVKEFSNGRIDFENRVEILKEVEFTVDATGTPQVNNKINVGKVPRGSQIIRALNLSNTSGFPTTQPFLSYTQLQNGLIQVDNITGLRPNEKYRLSIVFY